MVALFDKQVSWQSSKTQQWNCSDSRCDTDMWNNTSLCEHECCVPLIKLLQQPTCKCSSLADVVRLWKNTCFVCNLSVYVLRHLKNAEYSISNHACVFVPFRWLTLGFWWFSPPGTHKNCSQACVWHHVFLQPFFSNASSHFVEYEKSFSCLPCASSKWRTSQQEDSYNGLVSRLDPTSPPHNS